MDPNYIDNWEDSGHEDDRERHADIVTPLCSSPWKALTMSTSVTHWPWAYQSQVFKAETLNHPAPSIATQPGWRSILPRYPEREPTWRTHLVM